MKIIRKRNFVVNLFLVLFALSSFHVIAQRAPLEFSINAAGGVSTDCFQPRPKSTSSLGYDSDFGVGFSGFLTQQVGVHVGVGFGLYNVKSKIDNQNITTRIEVENQNDNSMLICNLHTTLSGYTEIHKSLFLNIPVMLQFQTQQKQYWSWKQSPKPSFYAMGGVKVLFLFNNTYDVSVQTLSNVLEFPDYGVSTGGQKFVDLGVFNQGYQGSGTLNDFDVMVMFALELGVKWRMANNICLYTGAFFDCALNDPIKDQRSSCGNYTKEENLIKSSGTKGLEMLKVSNKTNLMVVGVKLRFAFSKRQRGY